MQVHLLFFFLGIFYFLVISKMEKHILNTRRPIGRNPFPRHVLILSPAQFHTHLQPSPGLRPHHDCARPLSLTGRACLSGCLCLHVKLCDVHELDFATTSNTNTPHHPATPCYKSSCRSCHQHVQNPSHRFPRPRPQSHHHCARFITQALAPPS